MYSERREWKPRIHSPMRLENEYLYVKKARIEFAFVISFFLFFIALILSFLLETLWNDDLCISVGMFFLYSSNPLIALKYSPYIVPIVFVAYLLCIPIGFFLERLVPLKYKISRSRFEYIEALEEERLWVLHDFEVNRKQHSYWKPWRKKYCTPMDISDDELFKKYDVNQDFLND